MTNFTQIRRTRAIRSRNPHKIHLHQAFFWDCWKTSASVYSLHIAVTINMYESGELHVAHGRLTWFVDRKGHEGLDVCRGRFYVPTWPSTLSIPFRCNQRWLTKAPSISLSAKILSFYAENNVYWCLFIQFYVLNRLLDGLVLCHVRRLALVEKMKMKIFWVLFSPSDQASP